MAVRAAPGATRLRLVRQSLTESGLLALGGGAAGIVLAWAGVKAFPWLLPPNFPRLDAIELNTLVLATAVALSLLAGLFFGLAPALRLARRDVDTALKQASRGRQAGRLPTLFRSGLIVAEVALSLVLLLGGALIVRSFVKLQQESPGYNPSNTLIFTVALPQSRYTAGAAYREFFRSLQERIEGLAGVDSVGGNMLLPFGRSLFMPGFTFYEPSGAAAGDRLNMAVLAKTLPGYFQALQARLLAGRFFTHQDNADAELVAIIDETLAQTVWPGENPLGKRLSRGGKAEDPQYRKVVGVVEKLRLTRLSGERTHQVYLPVSQFTPGSLSYLVRTHLPPLSLLQSVRSEVHAPDPQLPLYDIGQLDQTLSQQRAPQRMTSMLMTLFAAIGLTLAMVGIYGVISFSVNRQTHEIGIRLALGAARRDIHRMVLGSGFRLAVSGVVLGLAASAALAQTIESLLFGVSTGDAANYLLVITIVMVCVLLACYIPARRAARVDPLVALRYE
ncbi:MAG: FtsX-like permease family protein [Acidobacteriota bacterium]